MKNISTLEEAKELIIPQDWDKLRDQDRRHIGNFHLGSFNIEPGF